MPEIWIGTVWAEMPRLFHRRPGCVKADGGRVVPRTQEKLSIGHWYVFQVKLSRPVVNCQDAVGNLNHPEQARGADAGVEIVDLMLKARTGLEQINSYFDKGASVGSAI
jgi:hypothetical protein